MQVAILGASRNPERYSYKALNMLRNHGYKVVPVHPTLKEIEGVPVHNSLSEVKEKIHTLTLYVGPRHIGSEIDAIVKLNPGRVIFNPGTESEELKAALDSAGIPYMEACTLVLLSTGQFEKDSAILN
ncbi:CoA-binding protein [Marispirochaeta aestuarii]|uniref:CoA-binding protein n=1 Tax=Marispirochaeta aestuarii TaxID=1963862 RepID=A0A1Y1RUK0_9SPIO|nr:CoA-binding protein [Marispirochaeta aestuarii]ORC32727.1 CoA-binding protein [Marispirochaeta aestuarii]